MRAAFALVLVGATLATPAHADALQDQVLAAIKASDTADVGFTQTTRAEQTGGKSRVFVTRYDPAAAPPARWSLTQVDGRAPTAKEIAGARKQGMKTLPSYHQLAEWFGSPATRVAQAPGSVTYRFARLPAGLIKMAGHDASADTIVDAVVNTTGKAPYVERIRMASSKPFRMKLVAKVERYVFTASYHLLADGRPFPTGNDAEIAGSLLGKSGSIKTRTSYSDVRVR